MSNREQWLANLEAERVTHSRESFTQVMARLDMERPESPQSMRIKAKMRADREVRRYMAEIAALRHAPQPSRTWLEKRLGEARLAAAIQEMYPEDGRGAWGLNTKVSAQTGQGERKAS